MRYKQFWPGDYVITIVDYNGTPSGSTGKVISRWIGTAYVIRLPDGSFRWLNSSEFDSPNPNKSFRLEEGDIGVLTSNERQHDFAEVGDMFQVMKVVYDVDYYEVLIKDKTKWYGGFQLAKNI